MCSYYRPECFSTFSTDHSVNWKSHLWKLTDLFPFVSHFCSTILWGPLCLNSQLSVIPSFSIGKNLGMRSIQPNDINPISNISPFKILYCFSNRADSIRQPLRDKCTSQTDYSTSDFTFSAICLHCCIRIGLHNFWPSQLPVMNLVMLPVWSCKSK